MKEKHNQRMTETLDRPLYVAVSVVHDGIYIYDTGPVIKLRHHIHLGEEADVMGIMAFDGKEILVASTYKFWLISLSNPAKLKYTRDVSAFRYEERFSTFGTEEYDTTIIPKKIYSKRKYVKQESFVYEITPELNRNIRVDRVFQSSEHNMITEEKSSNLVRLHNTYLKSKYSSPEDHWTARGYYYVISLEYHLGVFEKIGNDFRTIWLCTDPKEMHKGFTQYGQVRTMTLLNVPKCDEKWKEFQQQIFSFLEGYVNKSLSNIIAEYI